LQSLGKKVCIINEESLSLDRNSSYEDAKAEKITRSYFLAEVERMINNEVIVIVDSLNYIKGYRYELFCRARGQKTTICVIHCIVDKDTALAWNETRISGKWDPKLLEELASRFEVSNARNRWDRPLFTVSKDDTIECQDILDAIEDNSFKTKNIATDISKIEEPNFLYELDQITQSIMNSILEAQRTLNMVGQLSVPNSNQKVSLKRNVSLAELSRLKRQFIKLNSVKPISSNTIGDSFVIYLTTNLA